MKRAFLLTLSAAWLVSASAAGAADLYGGSYKDPIPSPIWLWTGFSVGAGIGVGILAADVKGSASREDQKGKCYKPIYEKNNGKWEVVDCEDGKFKPFFGLLQQQDFDLDGMSDAAFLATLQIAYDYQFAPRWVAGVFADVDWSNMDADYKSSGSTSISFFGNNVKLLSNSASANIETDWGWTVGGRLGYLFTPRVLGYGLIGWTHVNFDNPQVRFQFDDPFGGFLDDTPTDLTLNLPDDLDGVTLGGGLEFKLDKKWSLKTEYRFTHLDGGSAKISDNDLQLWKKWRKVYGRSIDEEAFAEFDADIHTVRAVLSYKFGGEAEPVPVSLK